VSGRILVTGASGFVGRGLVAALADAGTPVRAATRNPASLPTARGVEAVAVPDFTQPIDWEPLLAGVDAVVHLAGIAHVGARIDADLYDRVNHRATAELAAASVRANVPRFILVSSVRAQCGPASPRVLRESDEPQPTEAYGRSKLEAEAAVRACPLAWTILRPVVVYGPGVKGNLASLMRLARLPLPLPFAAFTSKRSLIGLDNLIGAVRFVLEQPATAGETYLVAEPEPVSLAEIVAALRAGAGRRPGLLPVPQAWLEAGLRLAGRGDLWERLAGALVVDTSKLIAAGWSPDRDTKAGLARMAAASL
jgi:nucleoside-diphosphate-sugar epimerase